MVYLLYNFGHKNLYFYASQVSTPITIVSLLCRTKRHKKQDSILNTA
jgi:hypothetical protein